MKSIILITALSLLSFNLIAQKKGMKSIEETQKLSKEVSKLFFEGEISNSVKILKKYWPLPEAEIEDFETKTTKYMSLLDARFGKRLGYEKVTNKTVSDFVIRETYIIRYDKSAIRLMFTYYKNDNGWIINAFKWDDSFAKELK